MTSSIRRSLALVWRSLRSMRTALVLLGACLLPRTRARIRNALAKPQPARELDSMRHYAERSVAADPARAIARARKVLRRRFFRVNETNGAEPAIAADKGMARDGGS